MVVDVVDCDASSCCKAFTLTALVTWGALKRACSSVINKAVNIVNFALDYTTITPFLS